MKNRDRFGFRRYLEKVLRISLAVHIRRNGHRILEAAAREREREREREGAKSNLSHKGFEIKVTSNVLGQPRISCNS